MRRVGDVMTTAVITATPSTPFKRLVELLALHPIGGLPVVDQDGRVLGMVSEADLLLKQEYPRDHRPRLDQRLRHTWAHDPRDGSGPARPRRPNVELR